MKGNLTKRSQAGFTLVELAIVMIIIGLLIAGVLKGQELIANAQVTSTVAQAKSIDAATSTFKDTYNSLPGDTANTRLPNCGAAAPCGPPAANLGDGIINNLPGATPIGAEGGAYFVQLNAAGLLSGITPGAGASVALGVNFPAAKISGNGFQVGGVQNQAAPLAQAVNGNAIPAGNGVYLTLTNAIGDIAANSTGLRPSQALRIDTKLDDATPDTGDVRAYGAAGTAAGTCGSASAAGGAAGLYSTVGNAPACGLYIRIQN